MSDIDNTLSSLRRFSDEAIAKQPKNPKYEEIIWLKLEATTTLKELLDEMDRLKSEVSRSEGAK